MSSPVAEKLVRALKKIDRPGSFCVSGSVPAVLPGLEVTGVGSIGFPLTHAQAEELKSHCQQAPYGKGEQTIVDVSVRQVWQLNPDQFKMTNPDWQRFLNEMVKKVQTELGLTRQKLESHLYNMLLYEPGSFFLPHRDGEKLDRMVATLVVVLPSSFQGGELIVRHEGQEQRIDFGSGSSNPFHVHFAAFYADCEHEVRPLLKGHRLCLIYNLTLAKSKKPITAPRTSEHVAEIAGILREWSASEPHKLAIPLEHQYTQDGLVWDVLKGVDRVKANVLAEAAKQAGCRAFLALLTFYETGAAEEEDYGAYWNRRRYYDDEDEEEESEDEGRNEGQHEMMEVFESTLSAEHFSDAAGKRHTFGTMDVEEEEVVPPESLTKIKPEEDYEGFTGNAGATLSRWYRHAAIVLWPSSYHLDVLCDCGRSGSLAGLNELVGQWREARKNDADGLRSQCTALAEKIISQWTENSRTEETETQAMMKALKALDDPASSGRFLREVVARNPYLDPGKSLVTLCEQHGWMALQTELLFVFENTTSATRNRNVRLLEQFCAASTRKKAEKNALCTAIAEKTVAALETLDSQRQQSGYWHNDEASQAELLATLTRALITADQTELLSRFLAHAMALPKKYPLLAHLSAIKNLRSWMKTHLKKPCAATSEWLAACCAELEALTAEMPKPPATFRRGARVNCKCEHCAELRTFLADPKEAVHRFRLRQQLRDHLENSIRENHCDVSCTTDRKGSPQTLVCTKNTKSYEASLKKHHEDVAHLAAIRAIQATLPR